MLASYVMIACDENVEAVAFGCTQECAILQSIPVFVADREYFMRTKMATKTMI